MPNTAFVTSPSLPALLVLPLLVLPGLGGGDGQRRSVRNTETLKETIEIDAGATPRIEVDNVFGAVRVTGDAPAGRIEMAATRTTEADSAERLEAAAREVRLDIRRGPTTTFYVDGPFRDREHDRRGRRGEHPGYTVRFDFELRVPPSASLLLKTVNHGNIVVSGVSGEIDVRNVNGTIELASVAGSGRAATVNGAITATFREAPTGAWEFKTVNGDLIAWFPEALAADVSATTMNGDVYTDYAVRSRPERPTVETSGGRRRIRVSKATGFRIGEGGPALRFDTLNGDIQVRTARQ